MILSLLFLLLGLEGTREARRAIGDSTGVREDAFNAEGDRRGILCERATVEYQCGWLAVLASSLLLTLSSRDVLWRAKRGQAGKWLFVVLGAFASLYFFNRRFERYSEGFPRFLSWVLFEEA